MPGEEEMSEAEHRLVAEWIVGDRAAGDAAIIALSTRYPHLHLRVEQLRAVAGRFDRDGGVLRGELAAALRGRVSLRDLDRVGELVARAVRERNPD